MKKFLIIDDHAVVRNGLKYMLTDEFPEPMVNESNAGEIFQKINESVWDLIIMDLNMPEKNGMEILYELKEEENKIPILILSMYTERQTIIKALRLGASGYISKEEPGTELMKAIHHILNGKKYVSDCTAQIIADQQKKKNPHEILSKREYEILLLIASGKNITQISSELFISVNTISTYRSRILKKMNMDCNAQLIMYSVRNNLV